MQENLTKMERFLRWVSLLTVLGLFPGFFFYSACVAFGISPPFLGGGFGAVALLLGIPLLLVQFLLFLIRRAPLLFVDLAFLIMMAYMLIWATTHYFLGTGDQQDSQLYQYIVGYIFLSLVLYVAFRNFSFNHRWVDIVLLASFIGMLAISLLNINAQSGMFYAREMATDNVAVATYQGFSRSALVVALLLLSKSHGWRMLMLIVTAMTLLFVLGSRSQFVGFILAASLMVYIRERPGRALVIWGPLAILALVGVAIQTNALESGSRILELFDIGDTSSFQARQMMWEYAVDVVSNHWLFGDYGARVAPGELGSYAHNALSAWIDFGLIGFLMFIGFNFFVFFASLLAIFTGKLAHKNPAIIFLLGISAYGVLMMLAAKSVYAVTFPVAWGAYAALRLSSQNRMKSE